MRTLNAWLNKYGIINPCFVKFRQSVDYIGSTAWQAVDYIGSTVTQSVDYIDIPLQSTDWINSQQTTTQTAVTVK